MHPRSRDTFMIIAIVSYVFAILADQGYVPEKMIFLGPFAMAAGFIATLVLILTLVNRR